MKLHQDDCHEAHNALKMRKKNPRLHCSECTFYTEDPRAMTMHLNGAHGAKNPATKLDLKKPEPKKKRRKKRKKK